MGRRVHNLMRWVVGVSLVLTSVLGYFSSQLLDQDAFAELISGSVGDTEVRKLLAHKAVDIAIDASDADAELAAALPEEFSAVATPALELSKPAIAEAGAVLLGVDAVEDALDAAARSVHRQTSGAIVGDEEADVVINALPVLVVVADAIAGEVGARAAVGLDLPESATTINLGSNQSTAWSIVRGINYAAAIALVIWLVSMLVYFVTAGKGRRLFAARRIGRTYALCGVIIMGIAWLLVSVAAVALTLALSPGDAVAFGDLSIGGSSEQGGLALAEIIFQPLLSAGRRAIVTGLVIVGATYVLGRGAVAKAFRQSLRTRDIMPLAQAVREFLPTHVRKTKLAIPAALVVLLMIWPRITLRVGLTLTALAAGALFAISMATSERPPAQRVRAFAGLERIRPLDATDRSERATSSRRLLWLLGFAIALVWPSYSVSGFTALVMIVAALLAWSYYWEIRCPDPVAVEALELAALDDGGWSLRRKLVIGVVVAAGVVLTAIGGDNSNPASAATLSVGGPQQCNGHAALCEQPLDEIAFAGTHNSMSANELGWELANHELAIPAQLDAGIRALLIDVQYWESGASLSDLDLDPEAAEIVQGVLSSTAVPEDGLWMCHNLCQLGGTPFVDFLADLRVFLETNPDEVLVIVIQDDAPKRDIKAAIEAAEIDEFAFAHDPGAPWPTLGEMIERNERLVFMAENDADAVGWYQLAFDGNVSESGFRYSVIEEFDCAESRGGNDGDFFMINHWVETGLPIPSEADTVNSTEILQARVDECIAERGRGPGIIAVNFWERGDLLAFVDDLNASLGDA